MAKKKRVKMPSDLSLAQLKQLVDNKASELSELKAERAALQKQLDELDQRIRETEGVGTKKKSVGKKKAKGGTATKKTAAKKTGAKKKKKVAIRKKKKGTRQNQGSAKDFAASVLKNEPEGLPLDELAQRILESGYKTTSSNFKNTLYQSLYNDRKAGKTFDYNEKTSKWVLR